MWHKGPGEQPQLCSAQRRGGTSHANEGEHTSLGLSKREEDAAHPKETRMRPVCPGLLLSLTPRPKRMTGQRAQGPAEHAPAGSGAHRARGMLEDGFRT